MQNQILSAIKKRRSVRKYKSDPISEQVLDKVIKAALYSPSARNMKKWKLIVVKDKSKIRKLGNMKPSSQHIKNAPIVIVIISEDWKYWVEDASIVAEHIWIEAENQGLSSCWTQVLNSLNKTQKYSEPYVREILGIDKSMRVLCMMPLGYPDQKIEPYSDDEIDTMMKKKVIYI